MLPGGGPDEHNLSLTTPLVVAKLQLILNTEKIPFSSNFNNMVHWNTNEDRFASPVLDLTFNFEQSSSVQDLKTENESLI